MLKYMNFNYNLEPEQSVIRWEITNKCNLACKHCFIDEGISVSTDIALHEAMEIVDELASLGVEKIVFSTKEPFMYSGFMELLNYVSHIGLRISIITNGTLISKKDALELSRLSIDSIHFSLEGVSSFTNDHIRGEGSFQKVIKTIKTLSNESEIEIGVQLQLNKMILKEVDMIIDFFCELGIESLSIGRLLESGNLKHNKDLLIDNATYTQTVERIAELYASTSKKMDVHFKGVSPYRIVLMNMRSGIRLRALSPKCSIVGGNVSIGSDGLLSKCLVMDSITGFRSYRTSSSPFDGLRFDQDSTLINRVESFKEGNSQKLCKECILSKECYPCFLFPAQTGSVLDCKVDFDEVSMFLEDIIIRNEVIELNVIESTNYWRENNRIFFERFDSDGLLIESKFEPLVTEVWSRLFEKTSIVVTKQEIDHYGYDILMDIVNISMIGVVEIRRKNG